MHINKMESDLRIKIRKYLEFTNQEEKVNDGKAEELLTNKLNSLLREEVILKTYGSILEMHPAFKENFSKETIRKLVNRMKLAKFSPEEHVDLVIYSLCLNNIFTNFYYY